MEEFVADLRQGRPVTCPFQRHNANREILGPPRYKHMMESFRREGDHECCRNSANLTQQQFLAHIENHARFSFLHRMWAEYVDEVWRRQAEAEAAPENQNFEQWAQMLTDVLGDYTYFGEGNSCKRALSARVS
jgi:hypothetical protein